MSPCPFCDARHPLLSAPLAFVLPDLYPVTPGHLLIIPRRHEANFLALTLEEVAALWQLALQAQALLARERHPDGYNLGVNVGDAAGQTVAHAHLHLIPRYIGDTPQPRGGVRAVIPSRQQYPS